MRKKILLPLVNYSGQYLRLDTAYFAKGGFWSTLQQVVGVIVGLTVSYLFGHFVSLHVFGEYNLVLSILSLLTIFSLPGVETALTRSVGQGYDLSLIKSKSLRFTFSLLAIPFIIAASFFYFLKGETSLSLALALSTIFFPFLYSFNSYQAFLTAKKNFKTLAVLSSTASLFFLIIMATGIFSFPSTPGITLAYLIAIIIPAIFAYRYSQRFIKKNSAIDINLGSYGFFLTLISVLPWISGHLGNIVLANVLGVEALAIYTVAIRFLVSAQKSFMAFYKPVTAKLAEQTTNQHLETLKTHGIKLLLIGFGLSAILWLATPILVNFFFTKTYQDSIYYGQLLSLALIPLPLSWVLSDMMIFQKRKNVQILMSTLPQTLKIGLYFLLIPVFKIEGLVAVFLLERYLEPIIPIIALVKGKKKIISEKNIVRAKKKL